MSRPEINAALPSSAPADAHERVGVPSDWLNLPDGPVRHTEQQLRTLAYELTIAEARERERIACGLHDDIGQVLAIVGLKLGELDSVSSDTHRHALIAELRDLVGRATQATRSATFDLSSPVLNQLGLQAAIESLRQRTAMNGGVKLEVTGSLPKLDLPDQVQAIVFRVVREMVANVVKHANARNAWIHLRAGTRRLVITVADDGAGFDIDRPRAGFGPDGGYGLFSADAQMQAVGGVLSIESAVGQGTRATIELPLSTTGTLGGDTA